MIYRDKRFTSTLPVFADGDEFFDCNFSQPIAHTLIGDGKTGLIFHSCTLKNCDLPTDAVKDDCNSVQVDHCYHEHPEMNLPVEVENCRHVIDTDAVTIDGQAVNVTYYRQDKDA